MLKQVKIIVILSTACVLTASAQTNTFPSSGNVGIGTMSPDANSIITAVGGVTITGGYSAVPATAGLALDYHSNTGRISVADGSGGWTKNLAIQPYGGSIGIGTTSPLSRASVYSDNSVTGTITTQVALGADAITIQGDGGANNSQSGLVASWQGGGVGIASGLVFGRQGYGWGTYIGFHAHPDDTSALDEFPELMRITDNGNVGIGTTTPGAKLEVDGNLQLTSGSGASIKFADSTTQSTAWTGTLTGGDYAESMNVTGSRTEYEPGDVLTLDPNHSEQVEKASTPYSRLVAGVYSTRPGAVGRRQKIAKELATTEVPMAMIGVVPVKVSTENGPIETGDLLVASSTAGYAMKGTDPTKMMGAVIGKSMGTLDSGKGVVEVLITLQ